jgi:hypothetical protein
MGPDVNTPDIEELRKKLAQYRSQAAYFFSKSATEGCPDAKAELRRVAETWCQLAVGAETLIREIENAQKG